MNIYHKIPFVMCSRELLRSRPMMTRSTVARLQMTIFFFFASYFSRS